ncbi:FHA domain-containing protein [Mucilaginibacter sp.]|uniref:FHA domain-containing protein n=1 Tax=Mucilaginibacter sp. TaxID=1882438 RepID=UPI003267A207
MFDIFNRNENKGPKDVKGVRDALLRSIKDELQKAEGGEGRNIKGIYLFIGDDSVAKHIYESAVYVDEDNRFRDEIQKIADDFDLGLPTNWVLETAFLNEFPAEAIKVGGLNCAIFIRTKDQSIQKTGAAFVRILNGEAEKKEYPISSVDGKLNIGREKRAQVEDGFFRLNHIAFPGDSANEANKYISRQHAHIQWNNEEGCFMLFADEGGIPPANKIKIRSASSENLVKLNSTHIGHRLEEGDQVILGETAVFEFSYKSEI